MSKKRLKTAEKSGSTSFWVRAAPKSWSKFTTIVQRGLVRSAKYNSMHEAVWLSICHRTPFCSEKKCTNLKFVILSANSNGNCAPDARFCRIKVIQGQDMLQFVVVYGRHQWKIFSVARCEITEFLKDRN